MSFNNTTLKTSDDDDSVVVSLVLYGVTAKMKKFKVRLLNTFFDCRTVRQVFDKKEAIFF